MLFSSIYNRLDIAIAHAGTNVLDNLFVQNNKLKSQYNEELNLIEIYVFQNQYLLLIIGRYLLEYKTHASAI